MHYQDPSLNALKLGQQTQYAEKYDCTLLQPVPRHLNRDTLGITQTQPFSINSISPPRNLLRLVRIFGRHTKFHGSTRKACRKWLLRMSASIFAVKI